MGPSARERCQAGSLVKNQARSQSSAAVRRPPEGSAIAPAGIFGRIAQTYFQRHGDQSDALAAIAAKNHKHGVANPYAQMRRDLGFAFCRTESEKNPVVAGPLKRTDCSLVSDGAAALVIADEETARTMARAVGFRAAAQVNDFLPMSKRDPIAFEGCELAWQRARCREARHLLVPADPWLAGANALQPWLWRRLRGCAGGCETANGE